MRSLFNVYRQATAQKAFTWQVPVFLVTSSRAFAFNQYKRVTSSKAMAWNQVGRIHATKQTQFNVLVRKQSTFVLEWNVGKAQQTQIIQTAMERTDFAY